MNTSAHSSSTSSIRSTPPTSPDVGSGDYTRRRRAIVVGAGPVGCLAALSLANLGWSVDIYEGRADTRLTSPPNTTSGLRSINLAVSSRGIAALYAVDPTIASRFLDSAIPMKGRMIHDQNGNLDSQLYDLHGQCIHSVERGILNEELLNSACKHPCIRVFFQHKLVAADFDKRRATFSRPLVLDGFNINVPFDFCVGADGSYSNVRRQMMRVVNMDYQQEYIRHQYIELQMPPGRGADGTSTFLIDPNHLHIWPRHSFMLIALPNRDKSFTCTLFAPTSDLARLDNRQHIIDWFSRHFPDALDLIGKDALVHDVLTNPRSSLISIKANPYHYKDRVVIIGDAAHSMVPFYGQGLNCGLEDVRILRNILLAHGVDGNHSKEESGEDEKVSSALEEYSGTRHRDLVAIRELAMKNYVEMRHDVTTPLYRFLRSVDGFLASFSPNVPFEAMAPVLSQAPYPTAAARGWIPLYTMVTFRPDINYATARARAEWQTRTLHKSVWIFTGVTAVGGVLAVCWLRKGWRA